MIKLIVGFFAKKKAAKGLILSDNDYRNIYGTVCGAYGIFVNLLLCIFKLAVGFVCSSEAVTADAVHSLADSFSSLVVMLSFVAAKNKYAEAAASLAVCFVLVYGGIKNAGNAFMHIASPEKTEFSLLGVALLSVSLVIKIYMSVFNRKAAKKLNSKALGASFADCLCDTLSTSFSLVAVVAAAFTTANVDAYCTLAVAGIMIAAGIAVVRG